MKTLEAIETIEAVEPVDTVEVIEPVQDESTIENIESTDSEFLSDTMDEIFEESLEVPDEGEVTEDPVPEA